jgi:hypothetical protein
LAHVDQDCSDAVVVSVLEQFSSREGGLRHNLDLDVSSDRIFAEEASYVHKQERRETRKDS